MNNIVSYNTYDIGLYSSIRLHKWVSSLGTKYAIGHGPIRYISKEEFNGYRKNNG